MTMKTLETTKRSLLKLLSVLSQVKHRPELILSLFFLAVSLLAVVGIFLAYGIAEKIFIAILGLICFIPCVIFFVLFCKWQKEDSQ